jgi:hypothetical protein
LDKEQTIEKLKKIVEKRDQLKNKIGGEIFAYWGILSILAYFIFIFAFDHLSLWIIFMVIGWVGSFIIIFLKTRKNYYSFAWHNAMKELWIGIHIAIILLGIVFPFIFHVYSPLYISAVVSLLCGVGMLATGALLKRWSIRAGGIILLFFSIILAALPYIWFLYPAAIGLGTILPAIWSKLEEKKQ